MYMYLAEVDTADIKNLATHAGAVLEGGKLVVKVIGTPELPAYVPIRNEQNEVIDVEHPWLPEVAAILGVQFALNVARIVGPGGTEPDTKPHQDVYVDNDGTPVTYTLC